VGQAQHLALSTRDSLSVAIIATTEGTTR
jgi:hypothetical protein